MQYINILKDYLKELKQLILNNKRNIIIVITGVLLLLSIVKLFPSNRKLDKLNLLIEQKQKLIDSLENNTNRLQLIISQRDSSIFNLALKIEQTDIKLKTLEESDSLKTIELGRRIEVINTLNNVQLEKRIISKYEKINN